MNGGTPRSAVHAARLSKLIAIENIPVWYALVTAGACCAVALLLRWALSSVLDGAPFLTFFPAVAFASLLGGSLAGVVAALIGAGAAWLLWIEPEKSLVVYTSVSWAVSLYLVVSAAIVSIVHLMRGLVIQAERHRRIAETVAQESRHRLQNVLAVVTALVRMSTRDARSAQDVRQVLTARIAALTAAQSTGTDGRDRPLPAGLLIERTVRPFAGDRLDTDGEVNAVIAHEHLTMTALVLHELATNALKYGALSNEVGRIQIALSEKDGLLKITWTEVGGPQFDQPSRTGSGSSLFEAFREDSRALELTFLPGGLRATVLIPKLSH